ncbi:hypothetical protein R1CP_38990 (plasmid) [Rhodococcus opacus]|uniref:Uncharacterized protein n=1 Tax=Rhodococcus opacus TaxID=37919 RepID=A0A1B1KI52_RHOOP|nr:hypothetical protein R1CP_38485 [Rhodococcus opacus]ANS32386.1 hypothetical protein R1CP_38990 [Rhodococcus opacus]
MRAVAVSVRTYFSGRMASDTAPESGVNVKQNGSAAVAWSLRIAGLTPKNHVKDLGSGAALPSTSAVH